MICTGKLAGGDNFKRLAGELSFGFNGHVGVIHGAKSNGAFDPFTREFAAQQVDGVGFHENITEIFDAVTFAARIAVDALMLAAAVEVEVIFQAKPGIGLFEARQQGARFNIFNHGYILLC